MGLFDQIAGQALSSLFGGNQQDGEHSGALSQIATSLFNSHGGLEGLLGKLKAGGLEQQVSSWVGTGENEAVDASQISSALGQDTIAGLANKFGLSQDIVSGGLAQMLPQLINHATPDGTTQGGSNELLSQGLGMLEQLFKKG